LQVNYRKMANPRIEVEIGAKVEGLSAGVNQATGQLDKLGKAAQTTAPQVDKLARATSGYNSVGIDFARIVQDAPFGIIGVGNNIQQLAGSFQVLKNQTGSTSSALKQAFASIFSSGNALVLGISILTSVFTVLQMKGFFKTEESAKSLDEALKKYQETLTGVSAATLKGAQDAQKEIVALKALELQATNTNLSTEQRTKAVNELQRLYPDYFGNLTKEQILNGNVGNAYALVTANLLAKAKAQAASNQIAQNGIDLLRIEAKLEEQRSKRLLETSAAQAQLDALIAKRQKEGFLTQGDLQRYDTLIKSINTANESLDEERKLQSEISRINKEDEQLFQQINKQLEAGASLVKDKLASTKANNDEKEKELKLEDELIARTELGNQLRSDAFKKLKTLTSDLVPELAKVKDVDLTNIFVAPEIADIDTSSLTDFVLRLQEFNSQVSDIIESGAQQTIGDFAFAIGDALASGGNVLKSAGAALLGGIAGILNQLGQLAIGTGLAIQGIKKALQTLNPVVAIGAGVALIALAGFVSSKAKSLGGGGGGGGAAVGASGVGGGGGGGGTAFTGGGATNGLFEQNRDVSGEFVVRGNDLVYVLGQANNKINKG
jgi:hypothetical protein